MGDPLGSLYLLYLYKLPIRVWYYPNLLLGL